MASNALQFSTGTASTGPVRLTSDGASSMLSVMVVDDQRTMRTLLRRGLRECGVTEVHEAANGRDALAHLHDTMMPTPDVIITDLIMDEMDGLELLQKVRLSKVDRIKDLPVIVLTGMEDNMVLDIAKEMGAANVLRKPISMPSLMAAVGQLVGVALGPTCC